jgi:hypothetical protein
MTFSKVRRNQMGRAFIVKKTLISNDFMLIFGN